MARDRSRGTVGEPPPGVKIDPSPAIGFERHEIGSVGFDDFLALIGGDYTLQPTYLGLRIPSLPGRVYQFILASCDLDVGERIAGFRQGVWIAGQVGSSPPDVPGPPPPDAPASPPPLPAALPTPLPPVYLEERPVVTPGWRYQDGWFAFHLRIEAARTTKFSRGPNDMASLKRRDAKGPCLTYETVEFPSPQTIPGYLGLSGYTRPPLRGTAELVTHEIRYPFQQSEFWAINHEARVPERAILYGLVLQTDPSARLQLDTSGYTDAQVDFAAASFPPEESFLQTPAGSGSQYSRIFGALIVDKFLPGKR